MKAKLKEEAFGAYNEVTNGFGRNDKIERGRRAIDRISESVLRTVQSEIEKRLPTSTQWNGNKSKIDH
ncbi:hypothetical protein TNCV_4997731 [Trichonephila clavipes]|nr:hypothetical protein TNCV_4997731 [Trichonephila clavipes]